MGNGNLYNCIIAVGLFVVATFAGCSKDDPKPDDTVTTPTEDVSFELKEGVYSYQYRLGVDKVYSYNKDYFYKDYWYRVKYVPVDNEHAKLVFEGKDYNGNVVLSPMTYGKPLTLNVDIVRDIEKDKVYIYCQDEVVDNIAYTCYGVFSSLEEWVIDDLYTKQIRLDLQISQRLLKPFSLDSKNFDNGNLNGNYYIQSDAEIEFGDKRKPVADVLYDMFSVPVASFDLYKYYIDETRYFDTNEIDVIWEGLAGSYQKKLGETATISLAQYMEGVFGYFDFSDNGCLRIVKNGGSAVYENKVYTADYGNNVDLVQYAVGGANSVQVYFTSKAFKMGFPCLESDNWFKQTSDRCYDSYNNASIANLFNAWKTVCTINGTSDMNIEIESCKDADYKACVVSVNSQLSRQFFIQGVIPFFCDEIRHLPLNKSIKMNLIAGMKKLGYTEAEVEQILQALPTVIENSSNFKIGVKAGYKKSESKKVEMPQRLLELIEGAK